ncbi:hypothetical protein BC941DRAFT_430202 [Chlamydoabsidia padenii]|nr:hypothetical protein BC941DRAFT_430202 [Chlamydoabsidia padenii]
MKTLSLLLSFFLYLAIGACFKLEPTYQSTPKNILFAAFLPGSSHIVWVLRFLDELANRGHNVTFVTMEENFKYAAPYPRLKTVPAGFKKIDTALLFKDLGSHPPPTKIVSKIYDIVAPNWRPSFETLANLIESSPVDVIICDHMTDPCVDIAHHKNLPLIMTSTLAFYQEASSGFINTADRLTLDEFTTLNQSFTKRFKNKFLIPLSVLPTIVPQLNKIKQLKRDAGYVNEPAFDKKTRRALKIVSTVFGLEPARPLDPLIELIGPIIATDYPDFDDQSAIKHYLDSHHRVAYVAFGQHARPDEFDVRLVLTGLIQQVEKGGLDGIVWSSKHHDTFPDTLTSPFSGNTYNLTDNKGPVFVIPWSPQMAVLLHPSVVLFVSHGGSNSLVESLYAGKRLLFYPFFGDQWGTAKQMTLNGLGDYVDPSMNQDQVNERVEKVVLDQDGHYQAQVKRYQALIQIHSKAAPLRAADLVEEVAFGHKDAQLPHRQDMGQLMSWIKRHNVDIYGVAVLLVVGLLGLVGVGLFRLSNKRKIKTL